MNKNTKQIKIFSGPLASLIANRWSCRVCMITGGLTVSISHVLTAFMPNITGVIFSLGVFGGKQMVVKNNVQYN